MREVLGDSYFNHLANLSDLVLLMDESHRYRGEAGMRAIAELKPVLGIELTATPQLERSGGSIPFRNVIYDYPLHRAMADGLVNLDVHLIGHEQEILRSGRAVRRRQKFQGFFGDAPGRLPEAEFIEHLPSALTHHAAAGKGAGLGLAAVGRAGRKAGDHQPAPLADDGQVGVAEGVVPDQVILGLRQCQEAFPLGGGQD